MVCGNICSVCVHSSPSHPVSTSLSSTRPSTPPPRCCPLSSRSSSLYLWFIFLLAVCSHFFCLVFLHCVSVSGVTSVVLPYGRWHHAVLPQGRTTDGMLRGVCVRPSVSPYPPLHPPPPPINPQGEGRRGPWERWVLVLVPLQLVVVLLLLILSNMHPSTLSIWFCSVVFILHVTCSVSM